MKLRLGTRKSQLARWQADWVAAHLRELGVVIDMVYVTTEGDVTTGPLGAIGGQGLFTKRIQQALLDNEIDLAVHSLKDLPTEPVAGLTLAAVPPRESPGDALVSTVAKSLAELPANAKVGTGSTRRRAHLLHVRSDLDVQDIRGNVDTRLQKLADGQYDAIVLAEAGLRRLGLERHIAQIIPRETMLPAVGQGALGIEARKNEDSILTTLAQLNDAETQAAVVAERALLSALRAGCLAPVGAWGRITDGALLLDAAVLSHDGAQRLAVSVCGDPANPAALGQQAAEDLLSQGAAALIAAARDT